MPFQLTPEEIKAALQAEFGINLNVEATSFFGQMANILAELRAADQQVTLGLYNSFDPAGAEDVLLDQRAALTGTLRRGETFSTVLGDVTVSGVINIPNGSLIKLDATDSQWELISGPIVTAGPAVVPATFQAVTAGPVTAAGNSAWTIITVIPNWDSFTNPLEDATPGQFQESDLSFRQRRNIELYSEDRGSLNAIAAVVSEVNTENGFVERVKVYHNPSLNPVDSNGIPFKAFNVVVRTNPPVLSPALEQDIADAIITVLGAGGEAYGTDVVLNSVDIEGQVQDIAFDLFTDADVYLEIVIETANFIAPFDNQPVIPLDGQQMADLVRDYVVLRANEDLTGIGQDTLSYQLEAFVNELVETDQVRGMNTLVIGSSLAALGPFLEITQIAIREIPDYDTPRVDVIIDGVTY